MPESDVSDTDALDAATTAFLEGLLSSLPTPGDLAEVCQPEIPMDQLQYMVRVGRCSGDTRHPSPRHAASSYHQARDLMMNPRSRFRHAAPRIMAEISTTKQYQVGATRSDTESPRRVTRAVSHRRVHAQEFMATPPASKAKTDRNVWQAWLRKYRYALHAVLCSYAAQAQLTPTTHHAQGAARG